jgi:hypothetical protein
MRSRDNASLSTLVTARLICVPMTTDTQITTDEYTCCWIECSVFGSCEVMKAEQFVRKIREGVNQLVNERISQSQELITQPQQKGRRS